MRGVWRSAAAAATLALAGRAVSAAVPAGTGFEEAASAALEGRASAAGFRLSAALPPLRVAPAEISISPRDLARAGQEAVDASPSSRKPKWMWIGAASALAIVGSAWNSFGDGPSQDWHFFNEGWFGRDTYAGGADKASHFTNYFGVTRIMFPVNEAFGLERDRAALVASGVSAAAGLITEIGDGTNRYGFAYEDLVMDWLGAATALAVLHYRAEDLIGFRTGLVPAPSVTVFGLGKDYSEEIYTGDLKIAGLARRLDFNPGPARFLLLSLTYGTKGYPYADPAVRQRQIGIELGIHFGEVLRALRVPEKRWWGVILYTFFDIIRIPYTAWGFRYDLNGKEWYGPDTGDSFPNPDGR